jgi:hypothetical protein
LDGWGLGGGEAAAQPLSPHYCLVIPTGVSKANGVEESADERNAFDK